MKIELLQKYISGDATEQERQHVTEWIQENPENMREYLAQRRLYDIALWHTQPVATAQQTGKRKKTLLHRIWIETAKIAAMLAIILLGTHYWSEKRQPQEIETYQTVYVPAGQRTELELADGTRVWLNSRSTLVFPGNFNGKMRNVKLDGEGYFSVAKNTERPFIVETAKCNVKVLGTEFNVMAYAADSTWETALFQGAVELYLPNAATPSVRMEPNSMVSLKGNRLLKSCIKETEHFRWREGLICFNNITVRDMFEKLKLYYGVDIVVNNTKILNNRYTGKFRTSDGIEHVLRVLRLKNRFTYTRDDENNRITIN
ncbi:FecR family protein [Bacteroides heparinolyticus]|uniref:FecR family protein n=1 Tax=Prevotella heparinolytica TaxID=28113 RepID=UPI0035A06854